MGKKEDHTKPTPFVTDLKNTLYVKLCQNEKKWVNYMSTKLCSHIML